MPLTAAYARLTEVFPALRVTLEAPNDGAGWVRASDLADGGTALEEYLAWDDLQVRRDYGQRARPDVTASFGLHRYAWPATLLFTVPWFLHRRVPRVPVADVSFHRADGRMTVLPRGFVCLPGDPAASSKDATVVPDEEALRAELRASVAAHIGPVLDGFRPRMRRGPRALWGVVTDEIVEGLWYMGLLLGEEERAIAELGTLLPGGTAPYPGGASFRDLTGPRDEPLRTRDRNSCCFFYTLRPAEACVTCPRTCDSERVERITANA